MSDKNCNETPFVLWHTAMFVNTTQLSISFRAPVGTARGCVWLTDTLGPANAHSPPTAIIPGSTEGQQNHAPLHVTHITSGFSRLPGKAVVPTPERQPGNTGGARDRLRVIC